MKPKLFSLLFAIVASIGITFASDTFVGDIWYDFDSNTLTAQVTYCGDGFNSEWDEYSGAITIPASVTHKGKTYSVTGIGDHAFRQCSNLKSVTINSYGSKIKRIGNDAFRGCSSLTSVSIPNSVTSIGDEAFYSCSSLNKVTIPNSVTSIGNYAFYDCSGMTTTIPNSVTSIGAYAFRGCSSLKSVTIPNSVKSISEGAFRACSGLTSVTIPNSVTSIGSSAFNSCSSLTSVTIPNSVTSIGDQAFSGCKGMTSLTIGNSVTSIGDQAFSGCSKLTSVTIPNSVTSIGGGAFSGCTGLTSVTIPNSVTSIGDQAFYNCKGMTSLTIGNSVTSIGDKAFSGCTGLTSVTIPNSVTSIGAYAFQGCTGLTSPVYNAHVFAFIPTSYSGAYTIPNGIESIAGGAFSGCSSLTSITIPNSVTSIGGSAFSGCTGLTSVTIPNSVTSIGGGAFSGCTGLTSVTIPNSVTSIGGSAFAYCSGLTSVTIPNSVTSIEESTFMRCSGLTSITIPSSVTSIGNHAFQSCLSLTSVAISNGVTIIGSYAFQNCIGLTSVTIPNSVTSIGADAFSACKISSVDFGGTIEDWCNKSWSPSSISSEYQLLCNGELQENVTIPNSVTGIGRGAFYGCSSLTSVTIPSSVTSIGEWAFRVCSHLTSVTIPNSVTSIGAYAFYNCRSLTSVTISNSLTSIENGTFRGCEKLTSVTIPNSVKSIGDEAFYNCKGLTSATIGNSVTSIGNKAFYFCTSLTSVTIGSSVTSIGEDAFSGCNKLNDIYVVCGNLERIRQLLNNDDRVKTALLPYNISVNAENGHVNSPQNSCDALELSAIPDYGYHFTQWSDGNKDNPRTIELTQDTSFTAIFAPNQYSINVTCDETFGHIVGESGSFDYQSKHTYEAVPVYGYHFVQWSDGNTQNPRTITVTEDKSWQAIFAINQYSINVTCDEAFGHIVGESGSFDYLSEHTYEAIPNDHYHFVQWSDGNTQNPRTITATEDKSCQAIFAPNQYSINVTCDEAFGHIVGESGSFDYQSKHTYEAVPVYGYHFVQWSDGNTQNPRTITVTEDKSWQAIFAINQYSINVTCDEAFGHIVGESGSFDYLSEHTYEAIPNDHYHFVQWSDGNTQNPRTITATEDKSCQAIFAIDQYSITVACDARQGSIEGENGKFDYGSEHVFKAVANTGYEFDGWSDGDMQNPRTIILKANTILFAMFKVADAIDDINSDSNASQIILRNGQIFIIRGDKTYTIQGQEVR